MKTFSDLYFSENTLGGGICATIFFPNNYGIEVKAFPKDSPNAIYSSIEDGLYQALILKGGEKRNIVASYGPIQNVIKKFLNSDQITELMKEVQNYEN